MAKKRGKTIEEPEDLNKIHNDKVEGYESDTPTFGEESNSEQEDNKADIADIPMGDYKKSIRDGTGPGLVQPAIPATANFKLNGHILAQLKDVPFYGKEHEDAYKHIEEVTDIADYFHMQNVSRDTVLLRMLLVTFKGAAKEWLKSLPPDPLQHGKRCAKSSLTSFVHLP